MGNLILALQAFNNKHKLKTWRSFIISQINGRWLRPPEGLTSSFDTRTL